MDHLSYSDAREGLAEVLNRVEHKGERVVIERRGKVAAAIVSLDDLRLLEALEDQAEEKWAQEAVRRAQAEGGKPIAWADLRKDLGLT